MYSNSDRFIHTDPSKCTYHGDTLTKDGNCHKCNVHLMLDAAVTRNVKSGKVALAITQLRMLESA